MKQFFNKIKNDVFPKIDAETIFEIDNSNLKNIFNVSAIVLVLQTVALSVFAIINHSRLGDPQVLSSVLNVGVSIPLFMLVMFISGRMRRSENYVRSHHRGVVTFVTVFAAIFLIWGMFASTNSIIRGEQILTFFTVQLCVVLFVRLRPIVSTILLLATYVGFFLFLELFFRHGMLNPYNYLMHVVLSIAGAIVNYHLTVSNIAKKNQIRKLNESLSQIANHDSLTRLKNRHALNEDIPDYLGGEVCVCMMDINKFKSINDTSVTRRATRCSVTSPRCCSAIFRTNTSTATAAMNFWSFIRKPPPIRSIARCGTSTSVLHATASVFPTIGWAAPTAASAAASLLRVN